MVDKESSSSLEDDDSVELPPPRVARGPIVELPVYLDLGMFFTCRLPTDAFVTAAPLLCVDASAGFALLLVRSLGSDANDSRGEAVVCLPLGRCDPFLCVFKGRPSSFVFRGGGRGNFTPTRFPSRARAADAFRAFVLFFDSSGVPSPPWLQFFVLLEGLRCCCPIETRDANSDKMSLSSLSPVPSRRAGARPTAIIFCSTTSLGM